VGAAIGSALARFTGALRQVQERTHAVHALGAGWRERIFEDLGTDKKNRYLMIDSTIVWHTSRRRLAAKRGSEDKALGRSRGGLSTKIHLLADEAGLPVAFRITPGQAAEYAQAVLLLEGQHAEAVIADKGYDSAEIGATIQAVRRQSSRHEGTGNSHAHTIAPCTSNATSSNAASTASSSPPLQHALLPNRRSLRSCTALACAWIRLQLYVDTA